VSNMCTGLLGSAAAKN